MRPLRYSTSAALAAAILGMTVLGASPASANVSEGYVAGAGVVTDDWGDEGTLSQNTNAKAYANGLWQWVLYAEGVDESNGSAYDKYDIDCLFGANTAYATKQLQDRWNLGVDGSVGTETFSRADNNLTISGETVTYHGAAHSVEFFRNADSHAYVFHSGSASGWTLASYSAYAPCDTPN
ncbi:peptidoglycan-binding protein [Streptomyces sp. NPDC090106]|uniref:peptidoglycan-binding domain-containing protein n=1 Tax=Streptomyces sp. NPDC090106 TaxID=3365946 RepID=UPI0037F5076E